MTIDFPPMNRPGAEMRTKEAMRATIVGTVVNAILVAFKFAAGIIGGSQALVADAVHSLSDFLTDVILLFTIRIAGMEADENHPYGHGRAETIGSVIMGGSLIMVGVFIVFEVIQKIIGGHITIPTWPAMAGAAASIAVKEGLFWYTFRIGKKINNQSVIANAWEHRSDSLSGLAALVGIIGAMFGYPIMDPLAAIVVVFMIEKVGWDITWQALKDLMDATLPPEQMREIRKIILSTKGVRRFHELRTRRLGADVFVDAHILVQPNISISEAHNIAESARQNLKEKAHVADALIHIDAEDDIYYKVVDINRAAVEKAVTDEAMKIEGVKGISEFIIHLLNGKVCVDFNVDMEDGVTFRQARERVEKLKQALIASDTIDHAVVRGKLTEGVMEHDYYGQTEGGEDTTR